MNNNKKNNTMKTEDRKVVKLNSIKKGTLLFNIATQKIKNSQFAFYNCIYKGEKVTIIN